MCEADDGARTRDLKLGKLALYQLSYVRARGKKLADATIRRGCPDGYWRTPAGIVSEVPRSVATFAAPLHRSR